MNERIPLTEDSSGDARRDDRPPPEPLAGYTGFLLSWHGRRAADRFTRALEPLGLRPHEFALLTLIEANPGKTQKELVTDSLIDQSSMVAVIDELEELGFAERRRHPSDRRKHAVHLTAKGKRMLNRAREAAKGMGEALLAPLTESESEALRRLLRKLAGVEP